MIYYYTCGDARNIIDGDRSKLVNGVFPSFISETRVFEYTFADSQKPQLLAGDPPVGDPLWRLPDDLAPAGNRNVAKLHFYDEPGEPFDDDSVAEQHARDEFALGTKRLGLPLTLTEASPGSRSEPPEEIQRQPGLEILGILPEEPLPWTGESTMERRRRRANLRNRQRSSSRLLSSGKRNKKLGRCGVWPAVFKHVPKYPPANASHFSYAQAARSWSNLPCPVKNTVMVLGCCGGGNRSFLQARPDLTQCQVASMQNGAGDCCQNHVAKIATGVWIWKMFCAL